MCCSVQLREGGWSGEGDFFSSDPRGVSEESFTSTENGTSLSAHGAQVAPSGRPLGGANW
jgi:hypothetical protein